MKKIYTTLALFISLATFSQRIMIEAGGMVLKDYTPGFNGGLTVLVSPKVTNGSGFGVGMEVYKTHDLPIGLTPYFRGILQSKKGLLVNMQSGYMFMSKQYDDGKAKMGGLFAKLGAGYISPKKIYFLFNLAGGIIVEKFHAGLSLTAGIKI